jgi:hypothetical protein
MTYHVKGWYHEGIVDDPDADYPEGGSAGYIGIIVMWGLLLGYIIWLIVACVC